MVATREDWYSPTVSQKATVLWMCYWLSTKLHMTFVRRHFFFDDTKRGWLEWLQKKEVNFVKGHTIQFWWDILKSCSKMFVTLVYICSTTVLSCSTHYWTGVRQLQPWSAEQITGTMFINCFATYVNKFYVCYVYIYIVTDCINRSKQLWRFFFFFPDISITAVVISHPLRET